MKNRILEQNFFDTRVIAIVRGIVGDELKLLLEALFQGGIKLAEITMNTTDVLKEIDTYRTIYDGKMHIGAGTVRNLKAAKEAISAGAEFIVTPNIDTSVIQLCREKEIMITPGVLTPTEIDLALRAGSEYIKVFPVNVFGASYIKDIMGPFPETKIVAVGGINRENKKEYFDNGAFGIGVSSSLCKIPKDDNYQMIVTYAKALINPT